MWHKREENHEKKENGDRKAREWWVVEWRCSFQNLCNFSLRTLVEQWPSSLILSIWTDENLKSAFNPFLSTLREESVWFYLLQYELLVHRDNVLSAAIFSGTLILHALRHQLHWTWCKNISWVLHYIHCECQGKILLQTGILAVLLFLFLSLLWNIRNTLSPDSGIVYLLQIMNILIFYEKSYIHSKVTLNWSFSWSISVLLLALTELYKSGTRKDITGKNCTCFPCRNCKTWYFYRRIFSRKMPPPQ